MKKMKSKNEEKTKAPEKILFVFRSAEFFHYQRTTIEALLARGFVVHMLVDRRWSEHDALVKQEAFVKRHPNFTCEWAESRSDRWRTILFYAREMLTYRHYISSHGTHQSAYYKNRWYGYLPPFLQRMLAHAVSRAFLKTTLARMLLLSVECIAPAARNVSAAIKKCAPDLVMATPGNMRFSSADVEYLKAAKKLGIRTAVPVLSWDNLTTKGLLHIHPDFLLCWNVAQVGEAVEHQGFARAQLRITGAPVFDDWFTKLVPSGTREEFCRQRGLRAEDPIVAYLGSSRHMAEDETWLVHALRAALDNSPDSRMRRTQIIIRPHPANWRIYEKLLVRNVFVMPKEGTLPDNPAALQFFYDTLSHAVAAIDGANTSAIIDSLIADCPGIAILTDEYRLTQIETKHFNQLVAADALSLAHGAEEVPNLLGRLLRGDDEKKEKRRAFVKNFIRPCGLEISAGEATAREVEKLL